MGAKLFIFLLKKLVTASAFVLLKKAIMVSHYGLNWSNKTNTLLSMFNEPNLGSLKGEVSVRLTALYLLVRIRLF